MAKGTTMVIIIRNNYKQQVTNQRPRMRGRGYTRSGSRERWPTPLLSVGEQLQVLELGLDGQSGWSVFHCCAVI